MESNRNAINLENNGVNFFNRVRRKFCFRKNLVSIHSPHPKMKFVVKKDVLNSIDIPGYKGKFFFIFMIIKSHFYLNQISKMKMKILTIRVMEIFSI
jgi:hypothetical protein